MSITIRANGQDHNGVKGIKLKMKDGSSYVDTRFLIGRLKGYANNTQRTGLGYAASMIAPYLALEDGTELPVTGHTLVGSGTISAGNNAITIAWHGLQTVVNVVGVAPQQEEDGLVLDRTTYNITAGGTGTLNATRKGSLTDAVTWESSDSTKVSVAGSGVSAVVTAEGSIGDYADITAHCGNFSATCRVTIASEQSGDIKVTTTKAYRGGSSDPLNGARPESVTFTFDEAITTTDEPDMIHIIRTSNVDIQGQATIKELTLIKDNGVWKVQGGQASVSYNGTASIYPNTPSVEFEGEAGEWTGVTVGDMRASGITLQFRLANTYEATITSSESS